MKKIRPSTSEWSHPVICVIKPNNQIRMCVDLRLINSFTIPNMYPTPRIEDILMKIGDARYMSTLDCSSGYWQVKIAESDRSKTAFITHRGLFEWNFVPFGQKTASQVYIKMMDIPLEPHKQYSDAFIDDTEVFSGSWKDHLVHMDRVLNSFRKAGVTLKLSKCVFGKGKIKFLGHEVTAGYRSPCLEKVEAIAAILEPKTKKLLKSFLGMCNFFKGLIPQYSKIVLPLTDLTRMSQSSNIVFNDIERESFERIKQELCLCAKLYCPDCSKGFIIRTDSSMNAVGATLSQLNSGGVEYPIAFASAKLSDCQARWSTITRESYGIVFALKKFEVYVFGSHIDLFTDHNPLSYVTMTLPTSSKLIRWVLFLSKFDITIKFLRGVDNVSADFLSRCYY